MSNVVAHTLIPDLKDLAGRTALVTGGTTGIGREVVLALSSLGLRVLTFARHEADLNQLLDDARQHEGEVRGLTADAASVTDVQRVFEKVDDWLGDLDILVNNAAVSTEHFAEESLDDIEYAIRANIVGYLACAHEAVARMRHRGRGHVVLVGSMSADLREEGGATYVATKGAIQAFAESLRKTVNEDGIKVTLIEPGKVATDMIEKPDAEKEEEVTEQRMLRPADVAGAVLFALLQPEWCDVVQLQLRPHLQVI